MEIANDSNYQSVITHSENLSFFNQRNISKEEFYSLVMEVLYWVDLNEKSYDETIKKHKIFFIMRIRDLGKNYIEVKLNLSLIKRQVEFVHHLIKYKEYFKSGNSQAFKYHKKFIDHLLHDTDSFKFVEEFISCNPFYFKENNKNLAFFEKSEVDDIAEYLNLYLLKEKELLNNVLNEEISPSIRHYFLILLSVRDILFSLYYKINFFNNRCTLHLGKSSSKSEQNIFFKMMYELFKNNNRLSYITSELFLQLLYKEKDLFDDIDSADWNLIKANYRQIYVGSKSGIKSQIDLLSNMITAAYASTSLTHDKNSKGIVPLLKKGYYLSYYLLNKSNAVLAHDRYTLNYDVSISLELFGIIENNIVKDLTKIGLPKVQLRNRYFIPIKEGFTVSELNQLKELYLSNANKDKIDETIFNLLEAKTDKWKISLKFLCGKKEFSKHIPLIYFTQSGLDKNEKRCIGSRKEIRVTRDNLGSINNNGDTFELKTKFAAKEISESDNGDIIIHIHGGAFVATSSTSHENYLRKWSIACNIPIISIDYTLSPEVQFPVALNEVFQAYLWIISESEIKINRIILAGDSAGGNLVAALINLLIITKNRLPDLILSIYPATILSLDYFTPSLLNSLEDVLLSYGLLTHILYAYLGDVSSKNPFASPYFMDDKIIAKTPKTFMYLGSADVLRDMGILYANKLLKNGCNCVINEFKNLSHGFVSFDFPLVKYMSETNTVIIEDLIEFLNS